MILLASIIHQFSSEFISRYQKQLLPSHLKALSAMHSCRNQFSPLMQVHCGECNTDRFFPHSCGHRNCPHCQGFESQRWIEQQCAKQVPADYFMVTFTLPAQLRQLAWRNQRQVYGLFFDCVWEVLQTFSGNDKKLKGTPGVVAVLHTHSRELTFHPHIHAIMPAAAIDKINKLWRKKQSKYLFNQEALAKAFRGKFLQTLYQHNFTIPRACPKKWVVQCKSVGSGDKALVYLGRYLYRGVIQEKDILSCENGQVTYRYKDSKTNQYHKKTVTGAKFLWLVLQHVLPRGFRRARNFGFLHPNSKTLIKVIQVVLRLTAKPFLAIRPKFICQCCGTELEIVRTRIKPLFTQWNKVAV